MSYYIIKPHTFPTTHVFLMVKKRDIPYEARHSVKYLDALAIRKSHRFSSLLEFLAQESGNEPYTIVRSSWVDILMKIGMKERCTSSDSESEGTSTDHY